MINLFFSAINYGGIGSIMGHEISHGFDDVGRQYDKNGNVNNWWTEETLEEFKNRTKCFRDKFSKYYMINNGTKYWVCH